MAFAKKPYTVPANVLQVSVNAKLFYSPLPPPLGGTFVRSEEVLQMSHRWNVGALVRPQLPNPTQIYISNSWWKQ